MRQRLECLRLLNVLKFNQIPKIKFAVKFIPPIARFASA